MKQFIRPITIEQVMNGFVVTIGCQKAVFNDIENLCQQLQAYVADPKATEAVYGWDEKYATEPIPMSSFQGVYSNGISLGQGVSTDRNIR